MHIYQIVIDNFKSFGEKTVIPFEKGFTTVSGPNGSGKSNIIDSMLFCLGLSTSRTMRAEKLSDLINNLSHRKECAVTITFRKTTQELERDGEESSSQIKLVQEKKISSATVAVEDADVAAITQAVEGDDELGVQATEFTDLDNAEFVQVTRRIKKGSQGYNSTYYLSGRPTTLSEIHEYLDRYNISPGTYNVMMQGDVAGIVNMTPMERRKIIDEIAGIADFDRKIDQAQKELETTNANIERNTILLNEIEVRLEELQSERDHALKYQKLRDEKHEYEGILLSAKYIDLKKAIEATQQNIADGRKEKTAIEARLKTLKETLDETRDALTAISNEVKKKGEDQQIALKKQIEGLLGHVSRKEDTIGFNKEKIEENTERIESMKLDIDRQKDNADNIEEEIKTFQHQLKELETLHKTEAASYEALNNKFDALTGSGSELSVKRNEVRKRLSEAEDTFSQATRDSLNTQSELNREEFELERLMRDQSEDSRKQAEFGERQTLLATGVAELDLEKSAFEAQVRQIQSEYAKTKLSLNTMQAEFNEMNRQYLQLEARKRAYDEVNFARSVEYILNSDLGGVHGTLAQLGSVDKEFALSVEIAMGARVQNIVVDNDQVAADGIDMLRQSKSGRATFLPLNKIQPARRLPALPSAPGVIDFAFNLLECDAQYDDVFAYALGDTLVVEDLESARPLLRKFRMITLDGSLLEKSGAMTGGAKAGRAVGYFAGNDVEDEIQTMYDKLAEKEVEKAELEKKLTSYELKLEGIKEEYTECLAKYNRLQAELDTVEAELSKLGGVETEDDKVKAIKANIKELAKQKETLNNTIAASEKQVAAVKAEMEGIESQLPSDQIESLREEMSEVKFQMDYYDSQIRNIQADIKGKEMEKNYQDVGVKDARQRIADTEAKTIELQKEIKDAEEEIELTTVQIKELEVQTTELDEELKKLQDERDAVQAKLIEEEKQKNVLEREREQKEEQIVAFQNRKKELDPMLAETIGLLEQNGVEVESIVEDELPSEEEVTKKITSLTRRMEAMEPVNMLAIKDYDRVSERRNELADKINTLAMEVEAINLRVSGYHELKLSAFMKAYEAVDNNFKHIFAELSDGTGELQLTNPESVFEGGMAIKAQPRGKKMQRIEAMSGGEKSLTSLAFVFALQRYMPAPFYALDEVDMNLDGINAEKLANMVKREADSGAQFVVVSLRKPMLEHSDRTVGVTQKKNGVTLVTGIKHRDVEDSDRPVTAEDVDAMAAETRDTMIKAGLLSKSVKKKKKNVKKTAKKEATHDMPVDDSDESDDVDALDSKEASDSESSVVLTEVSVSAADEQVDGNTEEQVEADDDTNT